MIYAGYVGITAMITLNFWVLYTPKAPFFRGRRGDEGKKDLLQGTMVKLKLILPCQDCTLLDILASAFFAFLSFALFRFLEGIFSLVVSL